MVAQYNIILNIVENNQAIRFYIVLNFTAMIGIYNINIDKLPNEIIGPDKQTKFC